VYYSIAPVTKGITSLYLNNSILKTIYFWSGHSTDGDGAIFRRCIAPKVH